MFSDIFTDLVYSMQSRDERFNCYFKIGCQILVYRIRTFVGWPPSHTADGPAGVKNIAGRAVDSELSSRLREELSRTDIC